MGGAQHGPSGFGISDFSARTTASSKVRTHGDARQAKILPIVSHMITALPPRIWNRKRRSKSPMVSPALMAINGDNAAMPLPLETSISPRFQNDVCQRFGSNPRA
jgi:hypothetical protein